MFSTYIVSAINAAAMEMKLAEGASERFEEIIAPLSEERKAELRAERSIALQARPIINVTQHRGWF